jgi:ADP-dependent NAD(P)H-hydrate dehydratase / NAD(P)H-hydrate epimerase
MRPLLTPEEMARADRASIEAGTPQEVLMERAGQAVAAAAIRLAGGRYGKRAVVVCGKGNNGGDGFVAARILAREGLRVRCLCTFEPSESSGAAEWHLAQMKAAGVRAERFEATDFPRNAQVIVDAIFGTGFSGSPKGETAEAISAINDSGAPVVAVDIPSGVDGTTGEVAADAVRADVTIAMAAEKFGTATGDGAVRAGDVEVADIGIDAGSEVPWADRVPGASWVVSERDVVIPERASGAHKRSSGSVLVIAGSDAMPGAAVMTATAALTSGSGYVTLASTREACEIASTRTPELVTTVVSKAEKLGADALDALTTQLERANALALGPGMGEGDDQRDLVLRALAEVELPLIIDADGLNVLAGDTSALGKRDADTILTPHPAELARLLDVETKEVQRDRMGIAARAAEELRCIVLLKGYRSVIAAFDAESGAVERWVIPTGGPELATAGTGDVLTGILAALVAGRPEHPRSATVSGAYLHGVSGEIAAASKGGHGVTAWDVLEAVPEAMARLT